MKTSNKIILGTVTVLFIFLLIGNFRLKRNIDTLKQNATTDSTQIAIQPDQTDTVQSEQLK